MRRSSAVLALALMLLACRAEGGIAKRVLGEGHTSTGTSCATGTLASAPVSSDTIVVFVAGFNSTTTVSAPTDTASNTYTQIGARLTVGSGSTQDFVTVWRKENATGGASFVVTGHIGTTSGGCTVIAWVLSGANTPTSYNGDQVSATATSTNPASGMSTPAPAASSFFVGSMTHQNTTTVTAGTNWQFETNSTQTDNTTFQALYTEDLTAVTTSSAQSATYTAASDSWVAGVDSFAPSGGGGCPSKAQQPFTGVGNCKGELEEPRR